MSQRFGRGPILRAIVGLALLTAPALFGAPALAQSAPLPHVTISIGLQTAQYADLFVAKAEGLFTKAGVDVEIAVNGGQYATAVLSGQAEVGIVGAVGTLPIVKQGKLVKVIYATGFGTANGLVIKANAPYTRFIELAGKKIGVFQLGQNRGLTQAASNWIVENGGKALDLAPLSTPSGELASLVASGIVDGAFVDPAAAAPYILAGKVKWLEEVTPGSPMMRRFMSADAVGLSLWGEPRRMGPAKERIARVIAGLRLAERWIATHDDAAVTASLLRSGHFVGVDQAQLQFTLPAYRSMWATKLEGYIPKEAWDVTSLKVWSSFDLGFDIADPAYDYDNRVDMSFWEASGPVLKALE